MKPSQISTWLNWKTSRCFFWVMMTDSHWFLIPKSVVNIERSFQKLELHKGSFVAPHPFLSRIVAEYSSTCGLEFVHGVRVLLTRKPEIHPWWKSIDVFQSCSMHLFSIDIWPSLGLLLFFRERTFGHQAVLPSPTWWKHDTKAPTGLWYFSNFSSLQLPKMTLVWWSIFWGGVFLKMGLGLC